MAAKKKSTRFGKLAGKKVEGAMDERKSGKLRSGRSGKKVTSKKQAIAIGLSEARRAGGKVLDRRKEERGQEDRSEADEPQDGEEEHRLSRAMAARA